MNLDEPEFQRQDDSTQSAMKRALDVLSKAAEKEQPGSEDAVPPLPEELRDQWLRELARQQAVTSGVKREQSMNLWQRLSEWWHAPKFWISGLATAAIVVMAVMLSQPKVDEGRITRGGEGRKVLSVFQLALIAETSVYDEFRSLRSGKAPARYESREEVLAEMGNAPVVLLDFSTQKILLIRDGFIEREVDFPSDDLLDLSMAVDELMAP
jgi:hypothetical protein